MSKNLNLDALLKEEKRVFVKSNSIKAGLMVVLEMKSRDGKSIALKIPPTETPICLSDRFSRDVLENSQDLRLALTKQNIVLMDETEALKALSAPGAQDTLKAFNMSIYADSSPGNPVSDSVAKVGRSTKKNVRSKTDVLKSAQNEQDVNVKVKAIIGSFKVNEKSAKDAYNDLLRMKSALTKLDLNYVMQQCPEDQTLKKFAESTLAEIAASPETPFEN